jgi:acyl carrier protein
MTKAEILRKLKQVIAKETGLPVEEISDSSTFHSLGLDSISAVFVLDKLEKELTVELNPMFFWEYPTVELLAGHITTLKSK